MITMPVEIYTDGSCLRNPGAGGWAYIIRYWNTPEGSDLPEPTVYEHNQGYRLTTNNRMEIMAACEAIRLVYDMKGNDDDWKEIKQINVYSDSEYLCNAINQRWINKWQENNWMTSGYNGSKPKPVKNVDLWKWVIELQELAKTAYMVNLTFTHVKGHNGNEWNERADKLAVEASSGTNHIIDEEYEKTTTIMNKR